MISTELKKVYTQPQLLTLIFFKDYLKKDYREIIDLIVEMDRIRSLLGLSTIALIGQSPVRT
jgi:flagellar motor component MotA